MALRKFSKYMKIMTVLIIISAVLSASYAGYTYLTAYFHNRKQVLFTLDGEKVYKEDYEKEVKSLNANIEELYKNNGLDVNKGYNKIPNKVVNEMALASVINNTMVKVLSHDLKIEVSTVDVNAKLTEIENKYGGKETLALMLAQKGSTIKDLKADIKDSLIYQKTIDKFKQKIKPTDKQLQDMYNRFKYTEYASRQFDEVKGQVEDMYYKQNLDFLINSNMEQLFSKSKISTKNKEIIDLFNDLKKVEIEVADVKVIRKDMLSFYASQAIQNPKGYYDGIEQFVNEQRKTEIQKLVDKEKIANSKGVKGLDGLTPINRIQSALQNYYYYLVDTYKPSDSEMKAWFDKNKSRYDTKNTISGEILGITYKSSEKDDKETEKRAKEVLKTLNKNNFAAKAKELSSDPGSKANGGELGWLNVSQLVPEFQVVRDTPKGSIIGPVKTMYGYHLIFVEDKDKDDPNKAKLKHILLKPVVSDETKNEAKKEVINVENDLKSGKITWEKITTDKTNKYKKYDIREQFTLLERNSALPKVGYSKELMDELFSKKVGDIVEKDLNDSYVIIQKTQEIPFKAATFEEFKDRVRVEMAFDFANKQLNMTETQ
ncbi:peptidylprolyl isomerase [uncultured Sneathia sp.]|uniref:peptidylprolyl isomerase n=1 Tax=uncultured Sneathia sp. TaxID=278067 RepID=UPI0025944605|nr:peptidylprolyl isomerase [uncultured Sneathia sp.]